MLAAISAVLVLAFVGSAKAAYEQVGAFATSGPGQEHMIGARGGAINATGAGGIPAGTLFVINGCNCVAGIKGGATYSPTGEFLGTWGKFETARSIAIDQTTGYIYLVGGFPGVVQVLSPNGEEEITHFGEYAPFGGTVDDSPNEVHTATSIAVDGSGRVYLGDAGDGERGRVMVFEPETPGDYEHYEYAGRGADLAKGFGGANAGLTLDSAGHLYVGDEEGVFEFNVNSGQTPLCEFSTTVGGIQSTAAGPNPGEALYYTYKNKKVHQLGCGANGKFTEKSTLTFSPATENDVALVVNAGRKFSADRPSGVLYALESSFVPSVAQGFIAAPAPELPPVVRAAPAAAITSSGAELRAEINPESNATRFLFQYLTRAEYEANSAGDRFQGAAEAPAGGSLLGEGKLFLTAATSATGLQPDTEYLYRAVATSHCNPSDASAVCEAFGSAEAFRTFPAMTPGLPDGRVYELVSPTAKLGGEVFPLLPAQGTCGTECKPGGAGRHYPVETSPSGDAVAYEGAPFTHDGALAADAYVAHRTATGWDTTTLSPTQGNRGYFAYDTNLERALLYQVPPALTAEAPAGYPNLYLQPTASPSALSPLVAAQPPNRPAGEQFLPIFGGASADLSRVFFAADDALTGPTGVAPAAIDPGFGKDNLYMWEGGRLSLVNVLPGNTGTDPDAFFGYGPHAISADGRVAFWNDLVNGRVYARIDGERTVEIPGAGGCKRDVKGEPSGACYLEAASDGSRVLLNDGELFGRSQSGESYEPITDLTAGHAGFKGIVGSGEDLSSIYFVMGPTAAAGALTNGSATISNVHNNNGAISVGQTVKAPGVPAGTTITAVEAGSLQLSAPVTATNSDQNFTAQYLVTGGQENHLGAKAEVDGYNLYGWKEGDVSFIGSLAEKDGDIYSINGVRIGDWGYAAARRTAEASPDGRWLSFMSRVPLTGYDNTGPCGRNISQEPIPAPCKEVFLYDSATGTLSCPSCNPTGIRPLGSSADPLQQGNDQTAESADVQPRFLTDQGRLYFDSADSLSPYDTNNGVEDVYQFEPEGVGNCSHSGGCVALISAGHEPTDSNFAAADPAGKNVFFTTSDQLALKDRDELHDLYVAREGGGIAAETEVARGECQGEACQALAVAPNDPTPSSSAFHGAGNLGKATKKKAKKRRHSHHKKKHHRKPAHSRATNHHRGGAK